MIFFAFLGWSRLIFIQLYRLEWFPGFHFDEAWAANWAHRIYSEIGFWPFQAQSPYAGSVSHYWNALWFYALKPSVLTFRWSALALVFAGLS